MRRISSPFSCLRIPITVAKAEVGVVATLWPPTVMVPASLGSSRATIDSRVDLPAPLAPTMEVMPPWGMVMVTSSTTTERPYDLDTA